MQRLCSEDDVGLRALPQMHRIRLRSVGNRKQVGFLTNLQTRFGSSGVNRSLCRTHLCPVWYLALHDLQTAVGDAERALLDPNLLMCPAGSLGSAVAEGPADEAAALLAWPAYQGTSGSIEDHRPCVHCRKHRRRHCFHQGRRRPCYQR